MEPKDYMKEIYAAFRKRDGKRLRKLDDAILREASLAYSKKLYYLAVVAYVLSKILGKPRFMDRRFSDRIAAIDSALEELSRCEEKCTDEEFRAHFDSMEKAIKNLEAGDPRFVMDLLSKGKLKVASTLYAQGISLGTAAEITGVEKQEILSYAGHTMMFDRVKEEKTVQDRLKALKELAGG